MKNRISIGDNIRILRENLGYSQDFIATKLDITQQAYSHIEKNPEKATLKRLKEIASILQVNLVTLLGEDDVYILHNFHQQGGNAATQMNVTNPLTEQETYRLLITELKEEILFLRDLTKTTLK